VRTFYLSAHQSSTSKTTINITSTTGKGTAHAIPADFYKLDDCKRMVNELKKRESKLHVLVNNSGSNVRTQLFHFLYVSFSGAATPKPTSRQQIPSDPSVLLEYVLLFTLLTLPDVLQWGAPYDEFPDAAWTRVLTLNLTRVFTITQAVTPLLEAAASAGDPARVINIGSVDGLRVPALETFSYSASKAGLHQLSRVLANHLGPRNITSNALACGPFQSKMMAATLRSFGDEIVRAIPLGRIGSPQDVAGACLFLASKAGSYVNGATIALDGGSLVGSKL
jgi:NAD(P)-dependent dehydrogenase (short-subunit alcohol dehydrogenase family)